MTSLRQEDKMGDKVRCFQRNVVAAVKNFREAQAMEAAAGIAYYALFSFFPFLLILASIGSTILGSDQVQGQVLNLVGQFFPPAQDLVRENLQRAFDLRIAAGAVAAVGLLWSVMGVFISLARNIDRAWQMAEPRNFLRWRLVGLAMAATFLAGMLTLFLLSAAGLAVLSNFEALDQGNFPLIGTLSWRIASQLVPWFLMFGMALVLYYWSPNTRVRLSEAGWGAVIAATLWVLTKAGFAWYLETVMVRYELIYGSLGTVIALMLWVYLSALIILFGAHMGASFRRPEERRL